jgi:ATP synthase protein I
MEPKKKQLNSYLQFSGLAFQMIGTLLIAYFIGDWIDTKTENTNHIYTIILLTLGTIASVYIVIKKAIQLSDKE